MRELDQRELPGYLLKYPEVVFFPSFFVALTFPESKRDIYLDISSAAALDRLFQQLQQCFPLHIQQCTKPIKRSSTDSQFKLKQLLSVNLMQIMYAIL